MIALCPTRWYIRHKALIRYKHEYSRIIGTLKKITDEAGAISTERKAKIRGWLKKLHKFETLFHLNSSIEIFGPCETLAKALQCPKMTEAGALRSVKILISQLEEMRPSIVFKQICEATSNEAVALGLTFPATSRREKLDVETILRKNYFDVLDHMINHLRDRFD